MLPEHVDPVVFAIICLFAVVFSIAGLVMLYLVLRVPRQGHRAKLRIVDFEIHVGGEGEASPPVYEVLDGPRAGDIVRSDNFSSKSSSTVRTTSYPNKKTEKLKLRVGRETAGWVHPVDDKGLSTKNFVFQMLLAMPFLLVGVGAIALAVRMYFR